MSNNVVNIGDFTNDKAKTLTNKQIVDSMMGEFAQWMKESYGFEANYQELRTIAISLFWSEFVILKRQAMAELQQEAIDKAEQQLNELDQQADANSSTND